jgi:hypothetical protein
LIIDKVRAWVVSINGPYHRKDGRQHIILYGAGPKRKARKLTVSYPKWLIEQHLGRELTEQETVDHKNRDFTDNNIDNLQVLDRATHSSLDAKRVKLVEVLCIRCGVVSIRNPRYIQNGSKQGKAGPFCGKSCAGKYGAEVQNGRENKLPTQKGIPVADREYYQLDKDDTLPE